MTATYYTVKTNGNKTAVVCEMLPASNKQMRQWLSNTLLLWENDGWCVKYEDDNTLSFHRGVCDGSFCIVLA